MSISDAADSIDKLKTIKRVVDSQKMLFHIEESIRILEEEKTKLINQKYPGCTCYNPESREWENTNYYCPLHGR